MNKNHATISVCITAYNDEKFIARCIDAVLAQQTNYDFEILVFDDHSTDRTAEITRTYEQKHPGIVKLIARPVNIGSPNNIARSIFECTGKYIARCDADDYWTDAGKLQKQIDFLEANPDFVICHHRSVIITPDSEVKERLSMEQKDIAVFEDLFNGNFILSNTVVLRNNFMPYPKWVDELTLEDWSIYVLYTQNGGKIKYFSEPMATHVKHGGGVFHTLYGLKRTLTILGSTYTTQKNFDRKYLPLFHKRMAKLYLEVIKEYKWSKNYYKTLYYTAKLFAIRKYSDPPLTMKQLFRNIVS